MNVHRGFFTIGSTTLVSTDDGIFVLRLVGDGFSGYKLEFAPVVCETVLPELSDSPLNEYLRTHNG